MHDQEFRKKGETHYWRTFSRVNSALEPKVRALDQLCFSSQFYFVSYLGASSNLFVIVGIMILLEAKTDPFSDPLVLLLLLVNQVVLAVLERLCLLLRRCFRLWEVPLSEAPAKRETRQSSLPASKSIKSGTTGDHMSQRALKG